MFASRRELLGALSLGAAVSATPFAAGAAAAPPSRPFQLVNLRELEERARLVLPKPDFDYIAGGAGDEWTMAQNEAALQRIGVIPQFLGSVASPDLTTTLLGDRFSCPIFVPGMGGQGMAHPSGEIGTATGAGANGMLMQAPTLANHPMEAVAAASPTPKWFQLYMHADRGLVAELLARAKASGYRAIAFTIDTGGSVLERTVQNGARRRSGASSNFSQPFRMKRPLDWNDVEYIQKASGLPVILKGVLSETVARQAVKAGVAGIQVSNHGGRSLDGSPATITVLPRLVDAADGKLVILMDGGVRRGADVFRALALGAHAVGVGRPTLFALALGGAEGVQAALAHLKNELFEVMRICGASNLSQIKPEMLDLA